MIGYKKGQLSIIRLVLIWDWSPLLYSISIQAYLNQCSHQLLWVWILTPKLLKFNFLFRFESYKDTLLIYPSLKCAFHLFVYHIFKKNTAYSKNYLYPYFKQNWGALVWSNLPRHHILIVVLPLWSQNSLYSCLVANISNNKGLKLDELTGSIPYVGHHFGWIINCGTATSHMVLLSLLSTWDKKIEGQTNWRKYNSFRGHLRLFFGKQKKPHCIKDMWTSWKKSWF